MKWWDYLDSVKLQENKASSCPRGLRADSEMKMGYKTVSWRHVQGLVTLAHLANVPCEVRDSGGDWEDGILIFALVTISQINFLQCTGKEQPKTGGTLCLVLTERRRCRGTPPSVGCLWVSQTLQGCSVQPPVRLHQWGLKGTWPTVLTGKNDQSLSFELTTRDQRTLQHSIISTPHHMQPNSKAGILEWWRKIRPLFVF